MAEAKDARLALYELYLATTEKVSDRRAQANAWMLSVNSAVVALYGYLAADKLSVSVGQKQIWLWAIVSVAWAFLLTSYRQLNRAKLEVLQEMEKELTFPVFAREREAYRRHRRRSLSIVETLLPICFLALYVAIMAAALWMKG